MIFTTFWFLVFVVIVVPLYRAIRPSKVRLWLLLVSCAIFHGHFAGAAGVLPILALGTMTYLIGLSRSKAACLCGCVVLVLALCFYKYTAFLITSLLGPWGQDAVNATLETLHKLRPVTPPLAVSFFTFEFVHYLVDIRKGTAPLRRPTEFVLFAIFFPSLTAGPIKRFEQFVPSMQEALQGAHDDQAIAGLLRIAVGFFKKIVIADNLTLWIEYHQPLFAHLTLTTRWLFVAAISMRILMDFSGYSDIALGFAMLLGIRLPENFNWPYLAVNLRDFWQRWHISLSSWIRDYVYIPLGGSRHGPLRKAANGLFAFALCGLWHGPAWNFVVWGIYHGLGLALCGVYKDHLGLFGRGLHTLFSRIPLLARLMTLLFVCIGWVFFFYPMGEAMRLTRLLFAFGS